MNLNKGLVLKIEKRSQPEWALFIVLLITLFNGFFVNVVHFPSAVKYAIDAIIIFVAFLVVKNLSLKKITIPAETKPLIVWIAIFFAVTVVVYLFNYQSALYYLWGLRNNFRFYVFFLCVVLFFNRKSIDRALKFLDMFFWANSAMCLIQFIFFGLKGDFLGGFFGTEKGCNGYLNIFLVIIATKSVIYYLNKKEGIWIFLAKCIVEFLIATLSEIKIFFVEFMIILLISILITNFSVRKLVLVVTGVVTVMVFASVLVIMFPGFKDFLSLNYFIEHASVGGYSESAQLNRLTTIPMISEQILTTIPGKIFGLGLGNCETSTFAFLTTPFYGDHIYLRYNWFSTAFLFLETGFLGLTFFFGFFILIIAICFLMSKKYVENKAECHMAVIIAALCIVIGIYNSSLRSEPAFLMYFMLALPFALKKGVVADE